MEVLRLKEVLKEKNISGIDLAKAVDVTPVSISNIVQGKTFPKPELLLSIAKELDVDVRILFRPTKKVDEHNHKEFEYDTITIDSFDKDLQLSILKDKGRRGWEVSALLDTTAKEGFDSFRFFLKREAKTNI